MLTYPPIVYANMTDEEFAAELVEVQARCDASAADLLDMIAEWHRNEWQDPARATFARHVLRLVASHLKGLP